MAFDWAAVVATIGAAILGAVGGTFWGAKLNLRQSKKERLYDLKFLHYQRVLNTLGDISGGCVSISFLLQINPGLATKDHFVALSQAMADQPKISAAHARYEQFAKNAVSRLTRRQLFNLHAGILLDGLLALSPLRRELEEALLPLSLLGLVKDDDSHLAPLVNLLQQRMDKNQKLIQHISEGKDLATFRHDSLDFATWVAAWNVAYSNYREHLTQDLGATLD